MKDKDTQLLEEAFESVHNLKENRGSLEDYVNAILEYGYGSGEEFMDYAMQRGLDHEEAQMLLDLLKSIY